jgi:ubiquinone/menaquinone biosynthesis C-methylase UbiE
MKQLYNSANQQLNSMDVGDHAIFLNFGYLSDGTPQSAVIELPEHTLNRHAFMLVLEMIGDCNLTDSKILDTGCGRGGTIFVITEYFHAKEITGLDLSSEAIAFCKTHYDYDQVRFFEGDSENMPFEDSAFDIVTNVESASAYPNIYAFFEEVYRVLKVGGYFVYTDLLPTSLIPSYLSALQEMGFSIEINRNITHNVLLSCDDAAKRHATAFDEANKLMENFLSLPGSKVYTEMENGTTTYRIFRFKKHH